MAARPSWEGFIKLNLISVPVKAYSATVSGGGKVGFHLLHKKCSSRIRYKKVCPIHGEVENDEIVSGYETGKNNYIVVDSDERKSARLSDDKALAIDVFIPPDALDPIYYTDRSYYLVPDGKVAQKPYTVLLEAMQEHERYAIAQVVFSGQGRLAVLRPEGHVLAMTLLSYEDQIKKPTAFEEEVHGSASAAERKMASTLIDAATETELDLGKYKDEYTEKMKHLLETRGKVKKGSKEGQGSAGEPAVINLMDALRKSLAQAKRGSKAKGSKKTPSHTTRAPRRRKHG